MTAFFATEYTIHFDDTMAYGSHHFLTGFKFQCASRETFMFGEFLYDTPGVPEEYDKVLFFTSDAYSRNLKSKTLGERVAILLSIEEWGLASARFCYRVIDADGEAVTVGFQTLVCADAETGNPIPLPPKVRESMDQVRQIEEPYRKESFRDRVLAGGTQLEPLFSDEVRSLAIDYLKTRYPKPQVISSNESQSPREQKVDALVAPSSEDIDSAGEVWVFAGQGAFDEHLLIRRVNAFLDSGENVSAELKRCESIISNVIGGDAAALFSGSAERISAAITDTAELLQPAIHLQNMLGGLLRQRDGLKPDLLTGHSFGEIAAFGLAGCFDLPTGVHIVCLRATTVSKYGPVDGGLMVAAATRSPLQTEASLQGLGQIVIAGRNHDNQTVLSGPTTQLNILKDALEKIGIKSMPIPSPTSFHHPHLVEAASHWLAGMRGLAITSPKTPVFTCIGRRLIDSGEDVAEILASQLLRPFDLQGSVSDITASGLSSFVDCGSAGSLARLIENSQVEGIDVARHGGVSIAPSDVPRPRIAETPEAPIVAPSPAAKLTEATLPSIAIVGSGCILPGGATSPEKLFESITQQRMGIVDVRNLDPWWSQDFYSKDLIPDKSTSHLSGRVNDADILLPHGVDPQTFARFTRFQKLLCISIASLAGTLRGAEKVTCLVGATADGFEDQDEATSLEYFGIDPTNQEVNRILNTAASTGRMPHDAVQEVFDLIIQPGLKVTLVDAACASSLYSVALGMNALESGEADAVIAGGCFCPGPGNSCLFSQFNGTTATGCRPFDADADGVVFSEAAAFVTLRRLDDAKQHGLPIKAAVRATGLSSDGRSPSANVPQTKGQILSLKRCYANYDIDPKTIQAIEGHGTSTSVGDSTELETLRQFFSDYTYDSIPVHSLKGTLGHAGWAAGTASVIAACEYLQRRTFPAQACHRVASEKLEECSGTLRIAHSPLPLPAGPLRVAVDGFGFGGANAHMVLENLEAAETFGPAKRRNLANDDLVFVAFHQLHPELEVAGGMRFDRSRVELPEKCIVLPELFDDMDISQTLTVNLTDEIITKLPNFDDDIRSKTSLVLALQGKTERGIEATARVLTTRFQRQLGGHKEFLASINDGYRKARPSGAYTLQCMMPNVATGRAALLFNLNGPNFVVDGGADSLASAIEAASLLLQSGHESGTRLAIIAAIDAASKSLPAERSDQIRSDEFAVALGLTTRSVAVEKGWEILGPVSESDSVVQLGDFGGGPRETMRRQVHGLLQKLDPTQPEVERVHGAMESAQDSCPVHTPAWIRQDLADHLTTRRDGAFVVVTKTDKTYVDELLRTLPQFCSRFLVVAAGKDASGDLAATNNPQLVTLDIENEAALELMLRRVREFHPDAIVATDRIETWNLGDSLSQVADENEVCEALFLFAKDSLPRLKQGQLELLGVFPGGYNGLLHTRSGSTAGLIKSILREVPEVKCSVVCTDDSDLSKALERLALERGAGSVEPEVSWLNGERLVRRLRLATSSNPQPQVNLNRDSVVIATGGARGVTAVMLESIAREHGCRIFAFGRSPLERGPEGLSHDEQESWFYAKFMEQNPGVKPVEMKWAFEKAQARWEAESTIRHLNRVGGTVEYLQVDVNDERQVQQALADIHSRYGRIDLLIHGAGVQKSMLLQNRTLDDFRRTYAVKVSGLNNLVSAARDQVGFMPAVHVLTSAYSIFGNDGQHDYCAANETMDRLCDMTTRDPNTNWSSIAWLAWDGIGMTRGSEYKVLAQQRQLSGVDAPTGQRIFRDVISGKTGAAINVPVSEAEHMQYKLVTAPPLDSSNNGDMIEVAVNLAEVGCLPYHLVHGTPTLPGAWTVDCFVRAALKLHPDPSSIVEAVIEQPSFTQFVRFANDRSPNVRVFAQAEGETIRTWLVLDVVHPSGELLKKDVVCAQATVALRKIESGLVSKLAGVCCDAPTQSIRDPYCQGQGQVVDLSGPFECIGAIEIGNGGRRADVDASAGRFWQTSTPALMLDAAWRVAVVRVTGTDDLFVPAQVGRLILPVRSRGVRVVEDDANWEIRSSQPTINGDDARWERTEVVDSQGAVQLVVENGLARQME